MNIADQKLRRNISVSCESRHRQHSAQEATSTVSLQRTTPAEQRSIAFFFQLGQSRSCAHNSLYTASSFSVHIESCRRRLEQQWHFPEAADLAAAGTEFEAVRSTQFERVVEKGHGHAVRLVSRTARRRRLRRLRNDALTLSKAEDRRRSTSSLD